MLTKLAAAATSPYLSIKNVSSVIAPSVQIIGSVVLAAGREHQRAAAVVAAGVLPLESLHVLDRKLGSY